MSQSGLNENIRGRYITESGGEFAGLTDERLIQLLFRRRGCEKTAGAAANAGTADGQAVGAADEVTAGRAVGEMIAGRAAGEVTAGRAAGEKTTDDAVDERVEDDKAADAAAAGRAVDERVEGDKAAAAAAAAGRRASFPPVDGAVYSELLNRYADMMLGKIAGVNRGGFDSGDRTGLDSGELMQECAIGLLRAAEKYDPEKGASFSTFLSVCLDNRIRDLKKRARSGMNVSVRSYEEIIEKNGGEEMLCLPDPESGFIVKDSVRELMEQIFECLSDTEYDVFTGYLSGLSYEKISARLGISVKAVDNALQRARKKLKALFGRPPEDGNKSGGRSGKAAGPKKKNSEDNKYDPNGGSD